jgi:alanine-glyoxylate transaminase/serine-glyoxylate transaminase/serine-pyruvate transaminase
MAPQSRLSLISRHLDQRPQVELNTPYAHERQSSSPDDIPYNPLPAVQEEKKTNMSNQPSHPALLIPGPIEFDDQVLQSMSHFRYYPRKPSVLSID